DIQSRAEFAGRPGLVGDQSLTEQGFGCHFDFFMCPAYFDPASLAACPRMNLCLDDPDIAVNFPATLNRLFCGMRQATFGNLDTILSQNFFGLIVMYIQSISPVVSLN